MGGSLDTNLRKLSNKDRAQDLVYQAMEAPTLELHMMLVRQALDLDPENVDALLMTVDIAELQGDERIEVLRGIVATGAKQLGKKAFKELVPHFWGFHETRPYMRARQQLAGELYRADRLEEAIQEYNEMLTLNEDDNQGVRFQLLACLLSRGRLPEVRALMERFVDDCQWNVVFAWGHVLEKLLCKDEAEATKALAHARTQNLHIEKFLTGRTKLPKNMPDYYSPGSKEEAACFAAPLVKTWAHHPEAVAWLSSQSKPARKSAVNKSKEKKSDAQGES